MKSYDDQRKEYQKKQSEKQQRENEKRQEEQEQPQQEDEKLQKEQKLINLKKLSTKVALQLKGINDFLFEITFYANHNHDIIDTETKNLVKLGIFNTLKNLRERVEEIVNQAKKLDIDQTELNDLEACIKHIDNITDHFSLDAQAGYEKLAVFARFYFNKFHRSLLYLCEELEQILANKTLSPSNHAILPTEELEAPNLLSQISVEMRAELAEFLSEEDLIRLSQTASDFYHEIKDIAYWRNKLIEVGCDSQLLKQIIGLKFHGLPVIDDYRKLFKSLSNLKQFNIKVTALWELLCLSGKPIAIWYAIKYENLLPSTTNADGMNPLHWVALSGDVQGMDMVIDALIIAPDSVDNSGYNALHYAAIAGHIEAMKHAVNQLNISANSVAKDDATCLILAAGGGHDIAMQCAADLGAPVEAVTTDNINAFLIAADRGHIKAMACAKRLGIDVLSVYSDGKDALLIAAAAGQPLAMEQAVALGVPIESTGRTYNDDNALLVAAEAGELASMEKAIELGIDPHSTNAKDMNALHMACAGGKLPTVKFSIETLNINPTSLCNRISRIGALHIAAAAGDNDVIVYLRQQGLDPYADSTSGDAFAHARAGKNPDVALNALTCPLQEAAEIEEGPLTRMLDNELLNILNIIPNWKALAKLRETSKQFKECVDRIAEPENVFTILSTPMPMIQITEFIEYYKNTPQYKQLLHQYKHNRATLSAIEILVVALTISDINLLHPQLLRKAIDEIEKVRKDSESIACLMSLKVTHAVLTTNKLEIEKLLINDENTAIFLNVCPYINLQGSNLSDAQIGLSDGQVTNYSPCLSKANLCNAILENTCFNQLDLSSTNLSRCYLVGAKFTNVLFTNQTNLTGAILKSVLFDRSISLFDATIDKQTVFENAKIINLSSQIHSLSMQQIQNIQTFSDSVQRSTLMTLACEFDRQFLNSIVDALYLFDSVTSSESSSLFDDPSISPTLFDLMIEQQTVLMLPIFAIPQASDAKTALEYNLKLFIHLFINGGYKIRSAETEFLAKNMFTTYERFLSEFLTKLSEFLTACANYDKPLGDQAITNTLHSLLIGDDKSLSMKIILSAKTFFNHPICTHLSQSLRKQIIDAMRRELNHQMENADFNLKNTNVILCLFDFFRDDNIPFDFKWMLYSSLEPQLFALLKEQDQDVTMFPMIATITATFVDCQLKEGCHASGVLKMLNNLWTCPIQCSITTMDSFKEILSGAMAKSLSVLCNIDNPAKHVMLIEKTIENICTFLCINKPSQAIDIVINVIKSRKFKNDDILAKIKMLRQLTNLLDYCYVHGKQFLTVQMTNEILLYNTVMLYCNTATTILANLDRDHYCDYFESIFLELYSPVFQQNPLCKPIILEQTTSVLSSLCDQKINLTTAQRQQLAKLFVFIARALDKDGQPVKAKKFLEQAINYPVFAHQDIKAVKLLVNSIFNKVVHPTTLDLIITDSQRILKAAWKEINQSDNEKNQRVVRPDL